VGPRAWDALPFELVEAVGAGIVARHDLDGLRSERVRNGESLGVEHARRRELKGGIVGRGMAMGTKDGEEEEDEG